MHRWYGVFLRRRGASHSVGASFFMLRFFARPEWRVARAVRAFVLLCSAVWLAAALPVRAEDVKIGVQPIAASGPFYVAEDRGYFAAEGLHVELVTFNASQPVAVAVVGGDITFGATGLTGSLYNFAAQDAVRIIASLHMEMPGFQNAGYVASNRAYAAGLTSFKDFPGHAITIGGIGSGPHCALGLLAKKYGFPLTSLRILQFPSAAAGMTAVIGGQADLGMPSSTLALPALRSGEAKLIGWVGDETPCQFGAVFTATKTADTQGDTVQRVLRAYRKGARDYHDAFTGPDGRRKDEPTAPDVLAIIARHLGQPATLVRSGIPYVDPEGRVDKADILQQIAWYKEQKFVKGDIDGARLIDSRYALLVDQNRRPEHSP